MQNSVLYNLPHQSTSFVGRAHEIAHIALTLEDEHCRLLTLVGPGGVGKTRLCIEVATHSPDKYHNGICFVPLQPINKPEFIITAIVDTLGLTSRGDVAPLKLLQNYLHEKHLLLILDNFEHLIDGSRLLSEIVQAAPNVKLLITSRTVLNLREEWVHHVSGLDFPTAEQIDDLDSYSALQLFTERARQVQYNSFLADERSCVVRICQLVEGNPLAIELAAAWLKTLHCGEIIGEIQDNLDFLTSPYRNMPEQHKSLRAVFNYSWNLLSSEEQDLFMRLSVFRSSFDRESAEQVAGASLLTLSSLVDKSMLRINRTGRYEVHELLRQLGGEQLDTIGATNDLHDAHSTRYLDFLRDREPDIKGRRQLEALEEIESELENIRVAWYWAVDQKHYDLIDGSMECLRLFCRIRNKWIDGTTLSRYAQENMASHTDNTRRAIWARLLIWELSSNHASSHKDILQAEQSLTVARQFGSQHDEAFNLLILARKSMQIGNYDEGKNYAEQSLQLFQALNDKFYIARVLFNLAHYYREIGQYGEALRLLE